jgi:hypothetical protein
VRNESRVDADWDEQWWVETRTDADGWTVEMQIPFRVLRFDPSNARPWGIDFERVIRRKNEETYWANWDRDFEFIQVSQAGALSAMDRIRPGQRLRVRPYVLSGTESLAASAADLTRARRAVGIDDLEVSVNPRPPAGVVRQVEISPGVTFNRDARGTLISREAEVNVGAEFQSGDEIELSVENAGENLSEEFEVVGGIVLPVGRYSWNSVRAGVESFAGRRLCGSLSIDTGGFYTGTRRSLEAAATLRAGRHLRMSPDYELNDVELTEGAFTTHLFGLRSDIAFSREAVVSLFFQCNSEGRLAATQVRFSYLFRNIDNLNVVYNEDTRNLRLIGQGRRSRLLTSCSHKATVQSDGRVA